jgi:hypothetical protein
VKRSRAATPYQMLGDAPSGVALAAAALGALARIGAHREPR